MLYDLLIMSPPEHGYSNEYKQKSPDTVKEFPEKLFRGDNLNLAIFIQ